MCPVDIESLILLGSFDSTSDNFQFVKISIKGCNLGADLCASDKEVYQGKINLAILNTIPNILGRDDTEFIRYQQNLSHYNYLDTAYRQITNIFFQNTGIHVQEL